MDVTQSEPLPLLLAPYSKVQHRNNHQIDHQQTRGKDEKILTLIYFCIINIKITHLIFYCKYIIDTINLF